MRKKIIGVMGPGEQATPQAVDHAYQLGKSIAQSGYTLLTGGRNAGVMEAASFGAKSAQGLVVGILPNCDETRLSEAVDLAIFTDLGNGRNNINVLSSDVVVACGMGAGTASEVCLTIKAGKPVILLGVDVEIVDFFRSLAPQGLWAVDTVADAIVQIEALLSHP